MKDHEPAGVLAAQCARPSHRKMSRGSRRRPDETSSHPGDVGEGKFIYRAPRVRPSGPGARGLIMPPRKFIQTHSALASSQIRQSLFTHARRLRLFSISIRCASTQLSELLERPGTRVAGRRGGFLLHFPPNVERNLLEWLRQQERLCHWREAGEGTYFAAVIPLLFFLHSLDGGNTENSSYSIFCGKLQGRNKLHSGSCSFLDHILPPSKERGKHYVTPPRRQCGVAIGQAVQASALNVNSASFCVTFICT